MSDDSRTAVEHFLSAYYDDPDETVIEAHGVARTLTVGHLRDLVEQQPKVRDDPGTENPAEFTAALAELRSKPHNGFTDLRQFCTTWLAELEQHGWLTRRMVLADGSELDVGRLAKALGRLAELERENAQKREEPEPRPGHGPGVPGAMHLEAFGQSIADAFGKCPYHVGSSATSKTWRDVDVRLILDDEQFHALFPGFAAANHIDAFWSLICAALSELGRARTGLPIDFQIQSMTEANANHHGIRNPLMLIRARDDHRPAMKEAPRG